MLKCSVLLTLSYRAGVLSREDIIATLVSDNAQNQASQSENIENLGCRSWQVLAGPCPEEAAGSQKERGFWPPVSVLSHVTVSLPTPG